MPQLNRQTVFISHANPTDNDAAGWLAAKLSVLGYQVWVDVEKLKGAESIWRTIEPVLRSQARCLILLLSHSTYGEDGLLRKGVSNEIELSLTFESELPRFVLPWILDDLPFKRLPIQLQGRMSVAEQRWSSALPKIIDFLDSLGISRNPENTQSSAMVNRLLIPEQIGLTSKPMVYDINRLDCLALPEKLFSIADDQAISEDTATGGSFNGRRISFNAIEGATRLFGKGNPEPFLLKDAMSNGIAKLGLSSSDIRRITVELVTKALCGLFRQKLLVEKRRADRRSIFYFNSVTISKGKVSVKLPEKSKRSYRNVWGTHKDIYWHLGIELSVTYADGILATLIPHIVFTKDSVNEPLGDDATREKRKQHKRRRAIAKLWFNDKWRGFYYPFLAHIRDNDGDIQITFEGNTPLAFAGSLSSMLVPITHYSVAKFKPDDFIEPDDDEEIE